MLIECARLRCGRIANVEERVSKLSASILLSIFPQIPALIYIGYFQEMVFPSDRLLSLWMLILIVVELIISISVLRKLIRMKTIAFYRTCRAEALQLQSTKIKQEADAAYWTKRKMEKSLAVENITMTTRRGVVVLDWYCFRIKEVSKHKNSVAASSDIIHELSK